MNTYTINGYDLTLEKVSAILADPDSCVSVADEAKVKCRKTRNQIDRWLSKDAPVIYGINTGLGALKDVVVPPEKHVEWNKHLPYPHSAGFGNYLPAQVTRLALLLRANILCRAYSAPRVELIERMLSLVNADIAPAAFAEGSTGLSDLAPLAQCAMVVAGLPDAKVYYKGTLMSAEEAFIDAGLPAVFDLQCKEVLMQMNGSTMSQAIALTGYLNFLSLFNRYKECCPAKEQSMKDKQQAYQELTDFIGAILELENNITCDNPLLFETSEGEYEAVMGCNCSNTQIGYVMDLMSVMLAEMADDLTSDILASAEQKHIKNQLKLMTMQVSADSIPTKGGQEDHVEFSYTAAQKAACGVSLLQKLIYA